MKIFVFVLTFCAGAFGATPRLDGRIVGGQQVDIRQYPYQASIRIYDQHICGGSIISANTILTAAHCVHNMDHAQFSVRVGETDHAKGLSVKVIEVREHKNYNPQASDYDMAILKLATKLPLGDKIKVIPVQGGGWVAAGTIGWVSGWGVTAEGGHVAEPTLRAVDVKVMTNLECTTRYGPGTITSNMLCAQTEGHDSCQGDSGGPLAVKNIKDGNDALIGVVSWGYGCAKPMYPGVYVNIKKFIDWVNSNTD